MKVLVPTFFSVEMSLKEMAIIKRILGNISKSDAITGYGMTEDEYAILESMYTEMRRLMEYVWQ